MLRASVIFAALLAVAATAGEEAAAELLSSRPITIIIPFTPGASADTLQRIVDKKVTENTGQTLVVESRPGGSGVIAATVVKHAPPDGHTLLQANAGTHATNASLYPTLPYDPIKDFRPITLMWSFPQLLAVPFDSPVQSAADLVALAKAKPGGLSFASQGTGSGGHLLGEMFKLRTGANMVHIPYRGAAPAATDLAAGRVDFFFVSYSSLLPFLQGGKVRAIAVTSPKRLPVLPDAPTMTESGFAGVALDVWFGLVAPGWHARCCDRQAQCGVRAGDAGSADREADDRPGRRGGRHHADGIRRVHRFRNRALRQGRASGRRQGRLRAALGENLPAAGA
jgi:tripartite-type tricarboxylate transporter receptor subunit TctC